MTIELTNDERNLVIELLDMAIADARQEIYHTESFEFKESLRTRKNLMEDLLRRLVGPGEAPALKNIQYH